MATVLPVTTRRLIKGALRLINVVAANEEPLAEDTDITLQAFDGLVSSLGTDILNIFTFNPQRFLLTGGKQTYTLGPAFDTDGNPTGADWVTERPMRIEQMQLILYPTIGGGGEIGANQQTLFLPIAMLDDQEYASIRIRALQNQWPIAVYDNGNWPIRTLSFWPIPTQTNGVEIWMWDPLSLYENLDQELNLPQGYERYLRFKLAVEVAPEFGKEVSPAVLKALEEAEKNVKALNQQIPRSYVSPLAAALQPRGRGYNYLDMVGGPMIRSGPWS